MSIEIKDDINIEDLGRHLWSGAVDTFNTLEEKGKLGNLENFLNEIYCCETPTMTEINDLLWFDSAQIFEYCGLDEDGEEPITLDGEDGEISDKYLEVLKENFKDFDYSTSLEYDIEDAYKVEIEGNNNTQMIFNVINPITLENLTKGQVQSLFDELNGLEEQEKACESIVHKFEVHANKEKDEIKVKVTVLGRILDNDIDDIVNFLVRVEEILDKYEELEQI